MFDDLSGEDIKETGNVVTGLLGQIGLIGSILLIGSFLSICILNTIMITGTMSLGTYIILALILISIPFALVYRNIRKEKEEEELKEKIYMKKETKMEGTEWIKWFFVIVLFTGIICSMWAAVMLFRADVDFGRPELLEDSSYIETITLIGITGILMITSFIVASLIMARREESRRNMEACIL